MAAGGFDWIHSLCKVSRWNGHLFDVNGRAEEDGTASSSVPTADLLRSTIHEVDRSRFQPPTPAPFWPLISATEKRFYVSPDAHTHDSRKVDRSSRPPSSISVCLRDEIGRRAPVHLRWNRPMDFFFLPGSCRSCRSFFFSTNISRGRKKHTRVCVFVCRRTINSR